MRSYYSVPPSPAFAMLRKTRWTLSVLFWSILAGSALLLAGSPSVWAAPAVTPFHSAPGAMLRLPVNSAVPRRIVANASVPPTAPSGLSLYTYPAPTSIELYWTSNSTSESSFAVERKVDGQPDTAFTPIGSADAVDSAGTRVYFTDPSGLSFDTVYDYRVRALAADGTPSDYSNTITGTTAPAKPISLTVASVAGSDNKLTLSWVDNANHTQYFRVFRKGPGQSTFTDIGYTYGGSSGSFTGTGTPGKGNTITAINTGLDVSSTYTYYVAAYNDAGASDASDTATGTTNTTQTVPVAPSLGGYAGSSGPAGTDDPKTTIRAYFTDESTNETSFTLQRINNDDSSSAYTTIATNPGAPGTGTFYDYYDTGLAVDTSYSYRAYASNSLGDSPYSNILTTATVPVKPISLSVSAVAGTDSKLTLSWVDNARHTSYFRVFREGPGQSTFTDIGYTYGGSNGSFTGTGTPGKGNTITITDTGLTVSSTYTYYVAAYNDAGASDGSDTAAGTTNTTQTVPTAPNLGGGAGYTGPSGTDDPKTTIRAYFYDYSTNSTTVTLQRLNNDDPSSVYTNFAGYPKATTGGYGTFYDNYDTGLAIDTSYSYRAYASNSLGDSPYSNILTVDTVPVKPITVQATPLSDTKIRLSWVDNARHTSYFRVFREGPGQSTFTDIGYTYGGSNGSFTGTGTPGKGNTLTITDTGLTVSSAYSYYVAAYDDAGASDPSNTATGTTFPTNPPGAPTDLRAAGATNPSQINLNWVDNSTTEYGFFVERESETESSFTVLPGLNPGDPTAPPSPGTGRVYFSDKTVADDTTYTYRVKATNPAGDSAYTNTIAATTAPTAVKSLAASAVAGTNSSILLTWTSTSKHEDGFNIYREGPGETVFTKRGFVPAASGPGSAVTFTDVGLTASVSYSYYVTAYNSAGESAASATVSATSGASAPTTVTITSPLNGAKFNVGDSIPVTVTAAPAVGTTITSYTLITNDVPTTQSSGSFTLTGLAAGTYTLKAKALDSAGNTATFPGITITVVSQPPSVTNAALTPLTLPAAGGTMTVTATLTDPNGAALGSTYASLLLNGAALTSISLSNGGTGSTYTGTYTAPANATGIANVYTATVSAQNAAGLTTTAAAAGSCTEASGNPVPVLTSLSPTSASLGATGLVLTVTGSGFVAGSTVTFGTYTGLVPVVGSLTATQFQVVLPNSALLIGGPVSVTVVNPAPAGGTSGALTFTVTVPAPLAPVLQTAQPGDSQVSLMFTTVANAATYSVKSAAQSGGPYTTDVSSVSPPAGAATVTAVDPNQANGVQKYYVVSAVGPAGESQNSNELSATPQHANLPPTVTLTSPADGTTAIVPASVTLTATASDADGTVAQVEFFQNGVSVGVVTTAPYTVSVSGLVVGTYTFKAVATDSSGASTISSTATVTVVNTTLGVTILSGPADESTVCANTVVFLWTGFSPATPTGQLRYEYQIDNSGTWSAPTTDTTLTLSSLAEGVHTFALRLLNADSTIAGSPVSRVFFVNLTAPTLLTTTVDARDTRATVNWITSKPTTGQIEFGTTTSYGQKAPADTNSDGAHNTVLAGLTTQTVYHYRVHFTDGCHDVVSPDETFTTTALLVPNLEVSGATVPGSFAPLGKIQVSWTVFNSGPGDALNNWTDSVYLSTSSTLDVTATSLGDFPITGPVYAFTNYTESQSLSIPRVPAGQYYLIIKTNSANTLPETSIADNAVAIPVQVTALQDLVVSPSTPSLSVKTGAANAITGQLTLTDLSVGTLSGITATVKNAPANLTVQVSPPASLQSLQSGIVTYKITALDASVLSSAPEIDITSGTAKASAILNIRVIPPTPLLSVSPMTLQNGMVRGGQKLVDFSVTNNGDAPAQNLTLAVPNVPWLSVTAPPGQGDLAPGATAKLELALTPAADLALGAYTGTIGINGTNAGVSVPFAFNCISSSTGPLKVVAQDEFSFFADIHPNIAGAHVVLTDSTTSAVTVDGLTGSDGVLNVASVPEGNYNVDVTADNHTPYHGQFAVVAGEPNEIDPFLSRQLVTYTWTVVPIPFTDTYTVVLEAVFETHVPAPIVTVDPISLDLDSLTYDTSGKAVVNYTLTNHGFIAANDTKFNITGQSNYTVTPALTSLGTIPPLSSVIVPVTIINQTIATTHSAGKNAHGKLQAHDFAGCVNDSMQGITQWSYDCGGPQTAGGAFILYVGGSLAISGCGLESLFESFGGSSDGGGDGGGSGGGSGGGGTISGPPGITVTLPCPKPVPAPGP